MEDLQKGSGAARGWQQEKRQLGEKQLEMKQLGCSGSKDEAAREREQFRERQLCCALKSGFPLVHI